MTREEALQVLKERMDYYEREKRMRAAIEVLVPEFAEKEDDKIRQALCDMVRDMPYMETELRAHGLTVERVLDYLENQSHDGKKWLTSEELHRIEQLRYEDGFDAGVRSEAEKQKERKPIFRTGDTIMAKACIPDEYVKKFKALCDAYEIKLPNRAYDIYHLCDDLAELFGNTNKQEKNDLK